MSPKIVIEGPEDRLTITPPRAPTPGIATSEIMAAEGGEITLAINGHVHKLPAFEEIAVSSEVLALLTDCGYEIEHLEEEEPST
jgi:hypothetical protein